MARHRVPQYPGALYHVTDRGNDQQDIFLSDDDRQFYLSLVARAVFRYRWELFTWCLMTNHYHLVFRTLDPTLSRGMGFINGQYGARFNLRRGRSGHVFEGRYRPFLIEKEDHLFEVTRYVVLNPVKASMVALPEDWPWSAYRATMGLAPVPRWLRPDRVLAKFGEDPAEARDAYRRFVLAGIDREGPDWRKIGRSF